MERIFIFIIKISIVFFSIFVSCSITAIGTSLSLLTLGYIGLSAIRNRFFYLEDKNLVYIILLFFASLTFSTIFSFDLYSSIKRTITILGYFILLFSILTLEKNYLKKILWIFFISISLHSLYGTVQYFTGLDILNKGYQKYHRIIGLAGHFNSLAGTLGLVFPLLFVLFYFAEDKKLKFIYAVLCFPVVSGIFLTFTRGIWLGLFVFFLLFGLLIERKFLIFLGAFLFLLLIYSPTRHRLTLTFENIDIVRKEFIKLTPKMILKRPILGYGPDSFRKVFYQENPEFKEKGHFHPHNMYLHILFENGILGLFSFFCLFFKLIRNLIKIYYNSQEKYVRNFSLGVLGSVLVFLVYGFVDEPFRAHYAPYVLFFLISSSYNLGLLSQK